MTGLHQVVVWFRNGGERFVGNYEEVHSVRVAALRIGLATSGIEGYDPADYPYERVRVVTAKVYQPKAIGGKRGRATQQESDTVPEEAA